MPGEPDDPKTPRWVKGAGVLLLLLGLGAVVLHLSGNPFGRHGP